MKIAWPSSTEVLRTFVFRIASLNKGSSVRLGGRNFRLDESLRRHSVPDDDGLFRVISKNLKPGSVFFDVGSNIGLYSLIAGLQGAPKGQVFAFEPDPANFVLLKRNIELNDLEHIVFPNQLALGDHVDEKGVVFYVSQGGAGSPESSLVAKGKHSKAVTLPLETIDNFCSRNGLSPSLIKIDTEGAEWPIINGALETIRTSRPLLAVEYHGGKTADFGYSVSDLWQKIDGLGYRQHFIMEGGDGYFMTLCVPA